jgi:hypothetical protein
MFGYFDEESFYSLWTKILNNYNCDFCEIEVPELLYDYFDYFIKYYKFKVIIKKSDKFKFIKMSDFELKEEKVCVMFSGGKDSTAIISILLKEGYSVYGIYYKNANLSSQNKELVSIEQISNYFKNKYPNKFKLIVKFIEKQSFKKEGLKKYWFSFPFLAHYLYFKTLFTMEETKSSLFSFGLLNGNEDLDCIELYEDTKKGFDLINPFMNEVLNHKYYNPLYDYSDSTKILYETEPDLLNMTSSCIKNPMFFSIHRKDIIEKYGNVLFDKSCGKCVKCQMLYLNLGFLGYRKNDKNFQDYLKYCESKLYENSTKKSLDWRKNLNLNFDIEKNLLYFNKTNVDYKKYYNV